MMSPFLEKRRSPENQEQKIRRINRVLPQVSLTPYNSATLVHQRAGKGVVCERMGGNCVDKLRILVKKAGLDGNYSILRSSRKGNDHFAVIANLGEKSLYLDPFLWQKEALVLGSGMSVGTWGGMSLREVDSWRQGDFVG